MIGITPYHTTTVSQYQATWPEASASRQEMTGTTGHSSDSSHRARLRSV